MCLEVEEAGAGEAVTEAGTFITLSVLASLLCLLLHAAGLSGRAGEFVDGLDYGVVQALRSRLHQRSLARRLEVSSGLDSC